ncbi:prolyl hydroxylase family protein [Rubinisphaera italica]|uniref:Fe2OG dioxygenase domain-containing protein n=1 Tax=Rubinisphaera italica TaxID=2527969 RepID=A0A5C5XJB2_9PLAN|nr:2OG-Fe(II) oxygenase [Rubinisphaera italica]TWT62808.1 hypothetical protein Pan54_35540 [Rubinisphaera italica]
MQRIDLKLDSIFLIEDFLTPEECTDYIALSESIGFLEAPISTSSGPEMRKDVRNNSRILHTDEELAARLYERAKPLLVPTWFNREIIGLNERFRFYRYEFGQRFAPHYDGRYDRGNGERSEFSFLIYLNDDYEGGLTRFFEPERHSVWPKTGTALVFYHRQLHEGAMLESGVKYVLRTDVMYA